MSIVSELTRLDAAKSSIAQSIEGKGVTVPVGSKFDDFPGLIDSIEGSSFPPLEPPPVWQKHPDWPDIVSIFNADVQPGYTKAYILLQIDDGLTTVLPGTAGNSIGGTAWKTSDGQFHSSPITHTWDISMDAACTDGYKTRWIIVYSDSPISMNLSTSKCLWVYFDCQIAAMQFGGGGATNGAGLLEQVQFSTNVVPPATLAAYAFGYCSNLFSITIPNGITDIGTYAFTNCTGLKGITLPDGLISIGAYAFTTCTQLKEAIIPESVTSLSAAYIFNVCSSLKKIALPSAYSGALGDSFLSNCFSLESLTIPEGVTSMGASMCNGCACLANVTLPSSLLTMGNNCFYSCPGLLEVEIPAGVTAIPAYCFYTDRALTKVTLPEGLTSIGANAFVNCSNLKELIVPAGVTTIPATLVDSGNSLIRLVFNGTITDISTNIFNSLLALEELVLNGTFTTIAASFLNAAYSLKTLHLPASITSIGTSFLSTAARLVDFKIVGSNFDVAISLAAQVCLSRTSLLALLAVLKDNTGFTAKTLTLGATNLNKLTAEEKAVATAKNWVLA